MCTHTEAERRQSSVGAARLSGRVREEPIWAHELHLVTC
jgi:hypothetical protein